MAKTQVESGGVQGMSRVYSMSIITILGIALEIIITIIGIALELIWLLL